MADITLTAQLQEAQRELEVRRTVYPRWIERGQITPTLTAHRFALHAAIVATLAERVAQEAAQLSLLREEQR